MRKIVIAAFGIFTLVSSCSARQMPIDEGETIVFLEGEAAYAVFAAIRAEGYGASEMANYEVVISPDPEGYRVGFSSRRPPSLVIAKGGEAAGPELLISRSGQILERTLQE